ncbi:MAG: glycosyltransferase family 2 protein [Candidatus Thorarchaeota archaeon]
MSKIQNISVVVPAYNEERNLRTNLTVIYKYLTDLVLNNFEILIIENGSTDNTAQIAKELEGEYTNIKSFFLPNPSYGEAYRYGILQAKYDLVTLYPVDLAFSLDFIKRAYNLVNKYPIVLGVRYHPESKVERPFIRVLISKIHTILVNIIFNTHYNDVDCLKAFRTEIGKEMVKKTISKGTFIEIELVNLIKRMGIKYSEIPVNHIEREIARHPFYILRSILKNFIELIKLKLIS